MEKYNEIVSKIKSLVKNSENYTNANGVKEIYRLTSNFEDPEKENFINWIAQYCKQDPLNHEIFEIIQATRYYYENETFSIDVAKQWLKELKEVLYYDLEKEKDLINAQAKIYREEAKAFFITKREEYIKKLNKLTQCTDNRFIYKPFIEEESLIEICSEYNWNKIKNNIVFKIPIHPTIEIKDDYSPRMIFWKATEPALEAYLMIEWLNKMIENEKTENETKVEKSSSNPKLQFIDLFKNQGEYYQIIDILIKEGHINQASNIWIDSKKGNLSVLVCIIKRLYTLNYFNQKPTNSEIKIVAKNSFNVNLSIDTVKKASAYSVDIPMFKPSPKN